MAKNSRVYFYLQSPRRDAKGRDYTKQGYFSVKRTVAEKLGLKELELGATSPVRTVAAHQRTATEYNYSGTVIDSSGTPVSVVDVAASQRLNGVTRRGGGKVAIIKTFDKIARSQQKGKKPSYHTISFSFPGWCTALDISDALGEILPETVFAAEGQESQSKIPREFSLKGGRRYPIMKGLRAEQRGNDSTPNAATAGTVVPESEAEAKTVVSKRKSKTKDPELQPPDTEVL